MESPLAEKKYDTFAPQLIENEITQKFSLYNNRFPECNF